MGNSAGERVYVALTTTGGAWYVQAMGQPGETRQQVEHRAMKGIAGDKWDTLEPLDIYQDTERKNLVVVSQSAARRGFPKAMRFYEDMLEYEDMRAH